MLARQLGHDARQREERDKVRDRHEAVERVSHVPHGVDRGDRADHDDDDVDQAVDLCGLQTAQILDAARAVQRPAEDRGEGEHHQRDRNEERGELHAEDRGEGARDQLAAGLDAPGDVHAADDDGQRGERADDDRVDEHLEDAVQALVDGALRFGGGVRDGGGAETGLVGEGAAAHAPDDRLLEHDAGGRAEDRARRKGAGEDQVEGVADAGDMLDDDDQRKEDVERAHEGDELFADLADALDAAEEDQRDERGENDAAHEVDRAGGARGGGDEGDDRVIQRADDGLRLRAVADAEGGERREYAVKAAEPFPLGAHAVLDIIHRAADPVALGVALTVADGEHDLGVLGDHAHQRGEPHPEHGAVAAKRDRLRGADDIARADGGGKRGRNGLERRDGALAGFLAGEHLADGVLECVAELGKLYPSVADRQIQASADGAGEENIKPGHGVQLVGKKRNNLIEQFHVFSPSVKMDQVENLSIILQEVRTNCNKKTGGRFPK